jgi:hypothetical protein
MTMRNDPMRSGNRVIATEQAALQAGVRGVPPRRANRSWNIECAKSTEEAAARGAEISSLKARLQSIEEAKATMARAEIGGGWLCKFILAVSGSQWALRWASPGG